MTQINCYFCDQSCVYIISGRLYYCYKHLYKVCYSASMDAYNNIDDPRPFLFFSTNYKETEYVIYHYLSSPKGTWITSDKGSVIDFPFLANLTPDNIDQKLPIILTYL